MTNLKLTDTYTYYSKEEHQIRAIQYLQSNLDKEVLEEFTKIWRNQLPAQTTINWNDMSSKVSKYFTVGEVTNNDVRRIPTSDNIKQNILDLAQELDKIREAWGSPIIVTSWYRPPAINKAVGGVSNSQHIRGLAADIRPAKGNIYDFQKWLDERWYGRLGYGAKKGFVHIDTANKRGWMTGHSKGVRWNY